MKITNIANNQQSVQKEKEIVFYSYGTIICTITNFENGNKPILKIEKGQPESRTTAKYLNKFLQMHTNLNNYKEILK